MSAELLLSPPKLYLFQRLLQSITLLLSTTFPPSVVTDLLSSFI